MSTATGSDKLKKVYTTKCAVCGFPGEFPASSFQEAAVVFDENGWDLTSDREKVFCPVCKKRK